MAFVVISCAAAVALVARRTRGVLLGLIVVAFGLGWTNASIRATAVVPATTMARAVPRCAVSGRVLEHQGGLGTLVTLDDLRCVGSPAARGAGVAAVDGFVGDPGSTFAGTGWLMPLSDERLDVARTRAGAHALLRAEATRVEGPRSPLFAVAAAVRAGLRSALTTVDPERAGTILGLSIGDTSRLSPETIDRFRASGLAHLLAVSGTNVALVLGALALATTGRSLRTRVSVGVAGLIVFVAIVGPDASVLRAAIMGSVAVSAIALGRRSEPLQALGLAILILVAVRPSIVFSVGLHLSAAATAGLVLWTGPVATRLAFLPRPVAVVAAATSSAQFAVAPVLVAVFGEVSIVSLVANLLAAPAVAPVTVLGLASAVTGSLWDAPARLLASVAEPFAAWLVLVARTTGEESWASVALARSWAVPLAAVAALAAGAALRHR